MNGQELVSPPVDPGSQPADANERWRGAWILLSMFAAAASAQDEPMDDEAPILAIDWTPGPAAVEVGQPGRAVRLEVDRMHVDFAASGVLHGFSFGPNGVRR